MDSRYERLPLYTGFRLNRLSTRSTLLGRIAIGCVALILFSGMAYLWTTPTTKTPPKPERIETPDIPLALHTVFDAIKLPITSRNYTDALGKTFKIHKKGPWWTASLKKDILIVDIDSRLPDGENELWADKPMKWDKVDAGSTNGMLTASQMHHFLYAQIHGYEYKLYRTEEMEGWHKTRVKVHAILELLSDYKFVIFLDGDAHFNHLDVPLEWMFNRWAITPNTSMAMASDVGQDVNGNPHVGDDSRGNLEQNTGFIVAQNLPYTFEMLEAWRDCPTEKRYEGCGKWQTQWAHEQTAWSEYIRYDFNPTGKEIVYIPGDDAMGYPGIGDNSWMRQGFSGQFIRHHTMMKEWVLRDIETSILQSVSDLIRKEMHTGKDKYWIMEKERIAMKEAKAGKKRLKKQGQKGAKKPGKKPGKKVGKKLKAGKKEKQ